MNNNYPITNMPMGNWELARVYVISQPYTNMYSPEEGLKRGTIFPDLYMPYINKESKFGKEGVKCDGKNV